MLTVRDQMLLTLAGAHYKYAAVRDTAFIQQTGYQPTAAWQRINWLLDQPEAMIARPDVVARLRRLRDARLAARRPGLRAG